MGCTLICKQCGKEFIADRPGRQFCSRECSAIYRKYNKDWYNKPSELVQVTCQICGKVEYVYPCRAKNYKTCSKECAAQLYKLKIKKPPTIKICEICGKEFKVKPSELPYRHTCSKECLSKYQSKIRMGQNNPNAKSVAQRLYECGINHKKTHDASRYIYQHIVKEQLHLSRLKDLPKGWVIHHKDCNHENNSITNLVLLPLHVHMLLHRWFGNILINALHTNKLDRETFFNICTQEQADFYKEIIDLTIEHQVLVKQGELLENPEVDNQHPSIYRNIIEGSTTNSRVLTDIAEDSNADTSALPSITGDDIV